MVEGGHYDDSVSIANWDVKLFIDPRHRHDQDTRICGMPGNLHAILDFSCSRGSRRRGFASSLRVFAQVAQSWGPPSATITCGATPLTSVVIQAWRMTEEELVSIRLSSISVAFHRLSPSLLSFIRLPHKASIVDIHRTRVATIARIDTRKSDLYNTNIDNMCLM